MTYIFVDDGMPGARQVENNYLFYDQQDLESMLTIKQLLEDSSRAKSLNLTVEKRALERSIAKKRAELDLSELKLSKTHSTDQLGRQFKKGSTILSSLFSRIVTGQRLTASRYLP